MTKELIGFDYETHLIGPDNIIPKPVCLSYWANDNEKGLAVGLSDMESLLVRLLSNKNQLKIAHNLTFEFLVTYKWFPNLRPLLLENLDEGLLFCTELHQRLVNNIKKKPIESTSLANLLNVFLEIDINASKKDPDAWRLRYKELEGVQLKDWPKAAIDYAIDDSKYCLTLYHYYRTRYIERNTINQLPHLQSSCQLNEMASYGILINQDRVQVLDREVKHTLEPIYKELHRLGFMNYNPPEVIDKPKLKKDGTPFKSRKKKAITEQQKEMINPYSKNMKALKEHLKANYKVLQRTKGKGIATDGKSLDFYLLEHPDDLVVQYFRFIGKYEKLQSAFINRLKTANPYIYTSYNPIVRSGRTSSRATSNYPSLNIQQQPR